MSYRTNEQIQGRYTVKRRLGTGGMATVYLAHDEELRRDVAIKVLSPTLAADPLFVERFKREAQSAAALSHPHIVVIYNLGDRLGDRDDVYTITMEYVAGQNLKELVRERGALPERVALDIAAQVASALGAAHDAGIVHRDIKPHNVLITPDGSAKVADFGIARALGTSQLTAVGAMTGSVHYLSPEQALHHPVDARSDLYSLGVVLYEMLTGAVPFEGDAPVAVALAQVQTPAPSPRLLRPNLSPRTEEIVRRALAKDPTQRFQTAGEMRLALEAARDAIAAPPSATAETAALPLPLPPVAAPRPVYAPPPGPVIAPSIGQRREQRRGAWLLLPLLLAVVLIGGAAAWRRAGGQTATNATVGSTPITPIVVAAAVSPLPMTQPPATATRGAIVAFPSSLPGTVVQATPTPIAPPTPAPVATVAAQLVPTAIPVVLPTPTTVPTVTAQPTPTPTTAPTTAPKPPTPLPAGADSPIVAVQTFYARVSAHQFDAAAALWSDRQRAQYPPDQNIAGRFARTTQIVVDNAQIVSQTNDRATVTVVLREYVTGGGEPPSLRGTWQLVRGPSGWLLDQPNFG